jgi:hypothetical protein
VRTLTPNVEQLTPEDEGIFSGLNWVEYEYSIADRNDYAVMHARTAIAHYGCRATRERVMPA